MTTKWACPKCGMNEKGDHSQVRSTKECVSRAGVCGGFICDCDHDSENADADAADHGETAENPCTEATCYHCGWRGTFPVPPKQNEIANTREKLVAFLKAMAMAGNNREAEELLAAMHKGQCPDCNTDPPCKHYPRATL